MIKFIMILFFTISTAWAINLDCRTPYISSDITLDKNNPIVNHMTAYDNRTGYYTSFFLKEERMCSDYEYCLSGLDRYYWYWIRVPKYALQDQPSSSVVDFVYRDRRNNRSYRVYFSCHSY